MKRRRLSDKSYVCLNLQNYSATTQFYVSRKFRKKYGGVILNEGDAAFDVQIESMQGYYSMRRTLPPGEWLEFRNYPLSGVTFYGSGTFTLVAWAGLTPVDFVRTSAIRTVRVNNFPPFPVLPNPYPVSQSGIWNVGITGQPIGVTPPHLAFATDSVNVSGSSVSVSNFPAGPFDVSDRAARLLGIIYGNLGQLDQRAIGGRNLATIALEAWLGSTAPTVGQKAMAASIPVTIASDQTTFPVTVTFPATVDVSDRAARLLGRVYGNLDKLQQRALTEELLVQLATAGVEYDARQIRALTSADVVSAEITKWIGSAAPTVGQKAMAASLPVAIASDQGTFPVTVTFPATFDVSDRAARLLGIVYGNLGQVEQDSTYKGLVQSTEIQHSVSISKAFGLGLSAVPGGATIPAFKITNPLGSGVTLRLQRVFLSSTVANIVVLFIDQAPANLGLVVNANCLTAGGAAALGSMQASTNAGAQPVLSLSCGAVFLAANQGVVYEINVQLPPNHTLTFWYSAAAAQTAVCVPQWIEF